MDKILYGEKIQLRNVSFTKILQLTEVNKRKYGDWIESYRTSDWKCFYQVHAHIQETADYFPDNSPIESQDFDAEQVKGSVPDS